MLLMLLKPFSRNVFYSDQSHQSLPFISTLTSLKNLVIYCSIKLMFLQPLLKKLHKARDSEGHLCWVTPGVRLDAVRHTN